MAQMQKRVSRGRRFFGWFGRHKVTAVFTVLLAGLILYLFVSWVVLQAQIHSERERFMAASQEVDTAAHNLTDIPGGELLRKDYCNYTTPTALFAQGSRGCEVQAKIVFSGISREAMVDASRVVYAKLLTHFPDLIENQSAYDQSSLAVYRFSYKNLGCFYSSSYYDAMTPKSIRDNSVPSAGEAGLIEVDCGGAAKAEYFPVVKS